MNTLNMVAAAAGLSLAVGGGLILRGDFMVGYVLLVIGLANLVRFIQLWRKE